jgi:uncharacterized protein (TIGR03086 family)
MTQPKPNPIELYEAASQGFAQALGNVKPNQMKNATPCTEWNVQALINHNIAVTGFAYGVLTENVTVDPFAVSGPLPKEGAVAALEAGAAKVLQLIKTRGFLEKQLPKSPFGPMTAGQFIMAPFLDLLVHRWDLAKGTGQSTTLDKQLVEVCYTAFAPMVEGMRRPGIIGPEVKVPLNASTQNKLLGIMGRKP